MTKGSGNEGGIEREGEQEAGSEAEDRSLNTRSRATGGADRLTPTGSRTCQETDLIGPRSDRVFHCGGGLCLTRRRHYGATLARVKQFFALVQVFSGTAEFRGRDAPIAVTLRSNEGALIDAFAP